MEQRTRDRESSLVVLNGGPRPVTVIGKVWLVGAGPGDPELLTRKAERLLRLADVVVYDRLVGDGVLALAAPGARRLYVGKRKSTHSVPQADLNDLLVALAREGLQVVRLKGGDPFMFGRGGEELAACRVAGIDCEVVPGVSAALAAAASSGAALTHRGLAQAVTFVTGHAAVDENGRAGEPDLDWVALARPNQTVVIYMGLSTAPTIASRLMAAGRAGSTPVLIVENASRLQERRALCTLATLPQVSGSFAGPAVLMVGEVVAMAQVQPRPQSHHDEQWRSVELAGSPSAPFKPAHLVLAAELLDGEHPGVSRRGQA
ncbi:uroporphyrinogen-III C-methyltransferase [Caulobacter sp. S45]|uniref:uroporphyrinogen-III C-methyltransferase n=1 Tax=Caulobacter sp. S45 TaxID=1641861 RepID=UPI001576C344|nr:uroporphyrinogen-III C-methyltransferase [Caulobacter sp. S45]